MRTLIFFILLSFSAKGQTTPGFVGCLFPKLTTCSVTLTGATSVCTSGTGQISSSESGGTWSSSATTVATVNSSGLVSGVLSGTATISYAGSLGCGTGTRTITVTSTPSAITGTLTVAVASTTTLSDATSSGIWSSTVSTIATIGSTNGVVTGLWTGTTTISYSVTGGCFAMATVTVTPPISYANYDASISASITQSVNLVSTWANSGGTCTGCDLTQGTSSKRPVLFGSGTSSKITFDGVDDQLTKAFTLGQPFTVYFIISNPTFTNGGTFFNGGASNLTPILQTISTDMSYLASVFGSGFSITKAFGSAHPTGFFILTVVFNNTTSSISANDGTKASGNIGGSTAAGGVTLGGTQNNSGFFCNVAFSQVFITNTADNAATQTILISYLRNKWGI